ncbi:MULTISPECIES: chemotaxis protein CheA [Bacillaceae]|uniref:Chemotaxis protein CheA n=1 Tax=Evansella alkalicola TaxID=745819 RepID=A0ABS6JPI3_9BACI|nr:MULTISPECIES: chemotaxis protein CheA [Bacillaceae]MBU9720340.1 chemotaxis protein CheA [Bacillus alkalicola]
MERNQYLDMFIDESKDHLQSLNDNLLKLESDPNEEAIISEIFRSAHTLKGMSATMGYDDIASLTHQMENVLDGIRNKTVQVTSEIIDTIFSSVDALEEMVEDIENGGSGKKNVIAIVSELERLEKGESANEIAAGVDTLPVNTIENSSYPTYDDFELTVLSQSQEQGYHTFYITIRLREDCILKAARVYMVFQVLEQLGEIIKAVPPVEELEEEDFDNEFTVTLVTKDTAESVESKVLKVSEIDSVDLVNIDLNKLSASKGNEQEIEEQDSVSEPVSVVEENEGVVDTSKGESSTKASGKTIRVNIDRLDNLMNLFEELVIDRGRLEQISKEVSSKELTETVEHMSRISGDLQNIILNMRMVPVEQVFNRFPRMVRGLAKDLNKEVNLEIIGAETELDRTVIDEIGDPLVHLLRNSIDHGLETTEKRVTANKNPQGKITLKAYHSGNHVFIDVTDDGAGINREKVLEKAINNGVVSREIGATYTDEQVYELLFASGLSTAEKLSDISGRGVGLDVVKNKIESLGGSVTVTSGLGEGTTFSIQLPLTLSILSVMLVEVQKEVYAIPLSSVIETAIITKEEIFSAHNQKVIDFRGRVVPLIDLTHFFDVPETVEHGDFYSIVIVRKGDKMAGLIVSSFIGQQEIVLKALGSYLTGVFAISGATILGNGEVALIVDCNSLIK